jgi:hypothetical protein
MVQGTPDVAAPGAVPAAGGSSTALTLDVARSAPFEAAAAAALDLHEELRRKRPAGGCSRWPERLRLVSDRGHFVRGRCGSTNQCDYCARLAAVENSEMLALDAMYGAPQVWCVLTTPIATLDTSALQVLVKRLVEALRRDKRLGRSVEYASILEYTTGYGPRSDGKRRPHWNLLLKGVTVEQIPALREVIERVWCAGAQASPKAQYVGPIAEAGGLMRYLALHFQKESQRPPDGFTGQRFNTSRGYYNRRTRAEMRLVARESLRGKRDLRQARSEGHEGEAADRRARELTQARWDTHWRLYERQSDTVPANEGEAMSSGSWLVPEVWAIALDADVDHLEAGPSYPPSEHPPSLAEGP